MIAKTKPLYKSFIKMHLTDGLDKTTQLSVPNNNTIIIIIFRVRFA